ncbi:bifunctional proline dehydrogenase/L-glutamate gamma-semialdehyde dehydrogenase PutA [Planktotalea arctica]|uniref:bifunctional proline dehydrogenase/L-glutamate gamma-semialdehyde dehydrogenase PutA n=1 Tax=Planktotalea arctica TaxID=1481893 RepID=UPI00321A67D8
MSLLIPRFAEIDANTYADSSQRVAALGALAALSEQDRARISAEAADLIKRIRSADNPGLMEVFLAEYGLSTDEGVALMCLAEALLRVPDAETIDALIEDKIAPSDWGQHLGHSASSLVNASTWALMLTGRVLQEDTPGPVGHLRGAIKRLGEPVIRKAVSRAMKEMGRQFVLGENITAAMERASKMEAKGYTYSYDMLGEAAKTDADARRYHLSYSRAISAIAEACNSEDIRANPGISVKLSALHPRYEVAQRARVMDELVPRLRSLALLAKSAGMGLNIDAEEADRLTLSLDVIEAVLSENALAGWDGFGVVVQAYGPRAPFVIDHLHALASQYDRRIMIRLVKGAYWDTEVKRAQVEGLTGFPVFTSKPVTDVSYIACARKLLGMTDCIYPQFATHNAHTVAAILHMGSDKTSFEFQRLHGMGEAMHNIVLADHATRCRIYAPVGAHRDLLAYLVRRLLENGANSSFVNQIVDEDVSPEVIASDPFEAANAAAPWVATGPELFAPERVNSIGFDLNHAPDLDRINVARAPFEVAHWEATSLIAGDAEVGSEVAINDPAKPIERVGTAYFASPTQIETALEAAGQWSASPEERRAVLHRAADLYEARYGEIFALLAREAGKTLLDAVGELREAVDFLRYYAERTSDAAPIGTFTCISPWNFPLAIFTGQISAALAAGNAVLAKPAEQTPLIAHLAASLLHEAGVPRGALQLILGAGRVGAALTCDPRIGGVAFTGSTETAQIIRASMARYLAPGAPLLAETGGLNAMIVDSTALPEQAITAIVESAFQSAGQRCSALRCLYVQEDVADTMQSMLIGAMRELKMDIPWELRTDVGPLIDAHAQEQIAAYVARARAEGRLLFDLPQPEVGHYLPPALIAVNSIGDLEREVFGPVLHIVRFKSSELDKIVADINATGYGLTFGLQTRIDDRVQHVCERIKAGNIYVNRNQIGAIVGSQPFGGSGLSGTGPKAGGPLYLTRFRAPEQGGAEGAFAGNMSLKGLRSAIEAADGAPAIQSEVMPGPTGELNRLNRHSRAPILCMGPGEDAVRAQVEAVRKLGGRAAAASGAIPPEHLIEIEGIGGVIFWGSPAEARAHGEALAARTGAILPLITGQPDAGYVLEEQHLCVDTTAAGGNTALLAQSAPRE